MDVRYITNFSLFFFAALNMVPDPAGTLAANGIPLSAFSPPPPVADPETGRVVGPGRPYDFGDWLLTSRPGLFGLLGGAANPTGVALMVILVVMVISSMKWMRKGGYFEVSQEEEGEEEVEEEEGRKKIAIKEGKMRNVFFAKSALR